MGITGSGQINALFGTNPNLQAVHNELNSLKKNMEEGKLAPADIKRFMNMVEKANQGTPAGFSAASTPRTPDQQLVKNILSTIQFFQNNFPTSKAAQEAASPVVVAFFKSLDKLKSGLNKTIKKKKEKVDKVEKVDGANDDMGERGEGRKG